MKKLVFYALALIFFSTDLVSSHAQTVRLAVDIPFNFNINEKPLPAGRYLILAQVGILRITGQNGNAAIVLTNPISGNSPLPGPGAVMFHCYGTRCFLSRVWSAFTENGQEIAKCRIEKELASEKEQLALITLRGTASR